MALEHADDRARRAGGEPGPDGARAATAEIDVPDAVGTAAPTTAEIETNTFSGPITVPYRVALGESGIDVHPLGLGATAIGRSPDAAADILDRFAALGGDLVATAGTADGAQGEAVVGEWISSRGTRDRVRLMTRVGPDRSGPAGPAITDAVHASLRRLGTDRIDLLAFHGEDPDVPLEESLGAVDALIAAGKVLAIGASGFSPERLIEARVLAADGLPRFQVLSTRYSLVERRAFEGAPELVARAQGLGVLPSAALGGGVLGGGVRRPGDLRRLARAERRGRDFGRRTSRVLRVLDAVAAEHAAEPAAVAIAWLLSRPAVAAPVVGVDRPEHVDALMRAASLVLTRSELVELDRASS
ncbi:MULTISPECIES: aldo/keto reductase [unclassified Agromyces]|uniref:aldo/keto reductase n=1 Tax=unclassified Agromyces TaxID=2639701 RepID=UPI003015082D